MHRLFHKVDTLIIKLDMCRITKVITSVGECFSVSLTDPNFLSSKNCQRGWTLNVYARIKATPVQNGIQRDTFDIIVKYTYLIYIMRDLKYLHCLTALVSELTESTKLGSRFFMYMTAQVNLQSQYICPSAHDTLALLMSHLTALKGTAVKPKVPCGFGKSVSRLEQTVILHIDRRKNE